MLGNAPAPELIFEFAEEVPFFRGCAEVAEDQLQGTGDGFRFPGGGFGVGAVFVFFVHVGQQVRCGADLDGSVLEECGIH
ncbi:hypothetical protein [Paenarthrobacter aurescens]|uniref:hypothetical protein n=1 Tax=Paenarthrobacter aurescens TaxID=43663 RepID=UPI0021C06C08|nr:hypothetical protein [Paenarthrobacter aurescens]MCT9870509.1 hypothetical protein [Paenarthrobacter aurescens]